MSRNVVVAEAIGAYAAAHSEPLTDVQNALVAATAEKTGAWAGMQIGADQAAFMRVFTTALQPSFAIETKLVRYDIYVVDK